MVAGDVSSSATPGARAWDVIVGDRFIAALAAPAPEHVLIALADVASDDRLQLEALVGLIPSGRVDPIESFGVVWWEAGASTSLTAIVRGDAVVDLSSPGGSRRFDARGIRPWHLAEFDDVVALRIVDAGSPLDRVGAGGEPLAQARASLRVSSIEWRLSVQRGAADDSDTHGWVDADTILAPHLAETSLRGAVADTVITSGSGRDGGTWAPTVVPPGHDSVVPADDAAEVTDAPAPADAVNGPRFRVGDRAPATITAPVLIGRRPLAPRVPAAGPPPELLTVESPGGVVSGTHLELRLIGTRLVATDLRSTNGTFLRTPSGARRLRAGESIVVAPGTILDLGDDTIIEILSAQGAPGA